MMSDDVKKVFKTQAMTLRLRPASVCKVAALPVLERIEREEGVLKAKAQAR
jgi:hypothetical protein